MLCLFGAFFVWAQEEQPTDQSKKTKIILLHADQGRADKIADRKSVV